MIFNFFALFWYFCSLTIGTIGILITYFNGCVPLSVKEVYLFGKLSVGESSNVHHVFELEIFRIFRFLLNGVNIRVPKRWFQHFYIFAIIYFPFLFKMFWFSCLNEECATLQSILNVIFGRTASNSKEINLFLVLAVYGMAMLHFCRRCYECSYVSIFSHSTMSALHYLMGYIFYGSFGLVVLNLMVPVRYALPADLNWMQVVAGVTLFVVGSFFENQSIRILSRLRVSEGSDGSYSPLLHPTQPNVSRFKEIARVERVSYMVICTINSLQITGVKHMSYKHFLPAGGLFDLVSCPHYLAEMLIYFGFYLLTNCDRSWHPLLAWVVISQVVAALLTHKWYVKTFKGLYPQNRKAIFPFVL